MGERMSIRGRVFVPVVLALTGAMLLSGCEEGAQGPFGFLNPGSEEGESTQPPARTGTTRLVERDVEAPEVFEVSDSGLWDGRPSLGGVWVAHPDVTEPERVIVRNTGNSKFVIGALFRRERASPGPVIQVSSDAAEALGMLAGAPATLSVTALRRETQPEEEPADAPTAQLAAPGAVETSTLDPVAETAAAAIEAASESPPAAPAPPASTLDKPYIQIGIFSVEQNAENTAVAMRQNGMVPTVRKQSAKGKPFWRVIVGPAANAAERGELLRKIRGVGFADAYPVTD